jgi:hypothetical protein
VYSLIEQLNSDRVTPWTLDLAEREILTKFVCLFVFLVQSFLLLFETRIGTLRGMWFGLKLARSARTHALN